MTSMATLHPPNRNAAQTTSSMSWRNRATKQSLTSIGGCANCVSAVLPRASGWNVEAHVTVQEKTMTKVHRYGLVVHLGSQLASQGLGLRRKSVCCPRRLPSLLVGMDVARRAHVVATAVLDCVASLRQMLLVLLTTIANTHWLIHLTILPLVRETSCYDQYSCFFQHASTEAIARSSLAPHHLTIPRLFCYALRKTIACAASLEACVLAWLVA